MIVTYQDGWIFMKSADNVALAGKAVPQRILGVMDALIKFIANSRIFAESLKNYCDNFTQGLDFENARHSSLSSDKHIYSYLHLSQQLYELYQYFITEKLAPLLSLSEKSSKKQIKLKTSFSILCDFLQVIRIVYAQMSCQIVMIESAAKGQVGITSSPIDRYTNQEELTDLTPPILEIPAAQPVRNYPEMSSSIIPQSLEEKKIAMDEMILKSTKSFDDMIDTVLAVASNLDPVSQSKAMEITGNTRDYMCRNVSERKAAKYLIELEEHIQGLPCSLNGIKLLLEDKMMVRIHGKKNDQVSVVTSQKVLYLFDNGLLVFASPKSGSGLIADNDNETPSLSSSQHYSVVDISLRLNVEDIFIEDQPERVDSRNGIKINSFVLICRTQVIMIRFPDSEQKNMWHRAIDRIITDNDNRMRNVKLDEIQTDNFDIAILLEQISFDQIPFIRPTCHDSEELSDLLWIKCDGIKEWTQPDWVLGKVMFDGKTMLLFRVLGWKSYNHILTWSFVVKPGEAGCPPTMKITENSPLGSEDWNLQLTLSSNAGTLVIQLMTTRQNRTDFWFDQFTKAIARNERRQVCSKQRTDQNIETCSSTSSQDGTAITATALSHLSTAVTVINSPSESTKRQQNEKKNCAASEAKWMQSKKHKQSNDESHSAQARESLKARGALDVKNAPITEASVEECERTPSFHERNVALTPSLIRVVLTGLDPTPAVRNQIRAIPNAILEKEIEMATHLIVLTHNLKRTVKLMCGISYCDHIYITKWLLDSANCGHPIENQHAVYCLTDPEAEQKWNFNLYDIMYRRKKEQRQKLFHGHRLFVTNHKSLLPPFNDLQKMVQSAGGTTTCKGIAESTDIVITTEAALAVPSVLKRLRNVQRVHSPELILSSILQQNIILENHQLDFSPTVETFILREFLSALDPSERQSKLRPNLQELSCIAMGTKLNDSLVQSGKVLANHLVKIDANHHITPLRHEEIGLRKRNIQSRSRIDERSRYERHKQRNRISMQRLRKREKEQIGFYHRLINQLEQEFQQHLNAHVSDTVNVKALRAELEESARVKVTKHAVWRMNNDHQRLLMETTSLRKKRAALREKRARANRKVHTLQELVRQPALSLTLCTLPNLTQEAFDTCVNSLSIDHIRGIVDASLQRLILFNQATNVLDTDHEMPEQEWNRLVATSHMKNSKYLFTKHYHQVDFEALTQKIWSLMMTTQSIWPGSDPWKECGAPRIIRVVDEDTIFILCRKKDSIISGVFLLFRRQNGDDTIHGLQSIEFRDSTSLDSATMPEKPVRDLGMYTKKHAFLFAYTLSKIRFCADRNQEAKQGNAKLCDSTRESFQMQMSIKLHVI
uniref:Uncharacterized protein AlNc14C41G3479 n=1 Tax=Albugo laibachii Nc14 TaxID=890382 RepID=F0W9M4_9STRA|nr:conserved hypothetical protein [Albugo laibachii Nc14]|eukprot:CCA17842.1 conserved hypothetical protein [Albugo laibachii Nc14]